MGLAVLLVATGLMAQEPDLSAEAAVAAPPAELTEPAFLYEITQHLYRWYVDEADVEKEADADANEGAREGAKPFIFWVRRLDVKLDEGDRSVIGELLLPQFGICVKVKKADYAIEDLGIEVKSKGFRIINVARAAMPAEPPPGAAVVNLDYEQMRQYLFSMRTHARFPDEALSERLRVAVRKYYNLDPEKNEPGEYLIYLAPMSPVANELWVFLENRKILIRFASDIDLEEPAMWTHQILGIRTYDIQRQTVVSLDEVAGSNEFLTRDQVGRALFNCVVLGRRVAGVNPE